MRKLVEDKFKQLWGNRELKRKKLHENSWTSPFPYRITQCPELNVVSDEQLLIELLDLACLCKRDN